MSIPIVGAVWVLSESQARKISQGFHGSIGIWVSKDGLFWSGGHKPWQSVDEIMPEGSYCSVANTYASGSWDALRQALLDGKLGPPTSGKDPMHGKSATSSQCACDLNILMTIGCPSVRGAECQSES